MAPRSRNFTWDGKEVTAAFLGSIIGVSATTIYARAKQRKTEVGEDLAKNTRSENTVKKRRLQIEMDGKMLCSKFIATEIVGIKYAAFMCRVRVHGIDSFLTYWPGVIPRRMLKYKKSGGTVESGNSEYGHLSNKQRTGKLLDIPSCGTWEANQ